MKRLMLLLSIYCCCSMTILYGQTKITGQVRDDADQQLKLKDALVMLLRAKDSILIDFARADEQGKFSLVKKIPQDYLLIVSYPKYADFFQSISSPNDVALGEIKLANVSHLLEEIKVTGRMAITIKGDTTEYNAGSFTVEKNAKVEDLLKVLPGISVDAAGKITAQGKTVKKVLVDGEEFFGNDPTLVTRNIRSDMVDKVQVYEKKSDVAERTGVDDGQREQTINVKLKDNAKNGIFGKALAGGGTEDYYMGQLMINKFKGSQKISAYGLFGNNATTSLSMDDAEKFGGDSGVSYGDEGSIMISSRQDDFSGEGAVGVPRAVNTGVSFFDKFAGDKHKLNLNYKYGRIATDGTDETLQSGLVNNNARKEISNENDLNRFSLRYDFAIDTLNSLLISSHVARKNSWTNSTRSAHQFNTSLDTTVRELTNEIIDNLTNSYRLSALFTHKFLKKGRSFSFDGEFKHDETKGGGSLFANVRNYLSNTDSITDQVKNRLQSSQMQRGAFTYTEPLSKTLVLALTAGLVSSKNSSLLESYNKSAEGNYDDLDRAYSNNYDFDRLSSNYKLALNYMTTSLRASLTNSLNNDQLKQLNKYTATSLKRDFLTYNPSLSVNYAISKSKHVWLRYSGNNQLPSLNQIQPIQDNADPLNRYIGNENLKPTFTNNINLGFNSFKALSGSYLYLGANASQTNDPMVMSIRVDNAVNYYEWQNINGNANTYFGFWGGYYQKLFKKLGINHSPQLQISAAENYNFFNAELNKVNTNNFSFVYTLNRETLTGLNFSINLGPSYKTMRSNLQPEVNSDGFVFNSNGAVSYFFSKTFKVYVNYDYNYEAATAAFADKFEQFLIHPGISKKFLKNESLMLDFTVNDLLNNNKGFSRSAVNSVFTERRYDTIQRYYMLKLSWDFTKMFIK